MVQGAAKKFELEAGSIGTYSNGTWNKESKIGGAEDASSYAALQMQ